MKTHTNIKKIMLVQPDDVEYLISNEFQWSKVEKVLKKVYSYLGIRQKGGEYNKKTYLRRKLQLLATVKF